MRSVGRLSIVLALLGSGCVQNVMLDGALGGAREASSSANTFHDYEQAREMAYAGVGQLEGMRSLRPDNPDGLFLLTQAWVGVGYAFAQDDQEAAIIRGDDVDAEYHRMRARAAFARAKFYGHELLSQRADGFDEATAKKKADLQAWLAASFTEPEQAPELFWFGTAWVSHVGVDTENPATIAKLWVGVTLIEHVVRLDESVEHGQAHAILGAFHARNAMGELDEAKRHFDRAAELGPGYLPTPLLLATRYHCAKRDGEAYRKTLQSILQVADPLPEARLANTVAKRRARRYLEHREFSEECGFRL